MVEAYIATTILLFATVFVNFAISITSFAARAIFACDRSHTHRSDPHIRWFDAILMYLTATELLTYTGNSTIFLFTTAFVCQTGFRLGRRFLFTTFVACASSFILTIHDPFYPTPLLIFITSINFAFSVFEYIFTIFSFLTTLILPFSILTYSFPFVTVILRANIVIIAIFFC